MYESFTILLATSTLFLLINAKLLKLPTSIGLLILGMLLSLVFFGFSYFMPDVYAKFPHVLQQLDFNYFLMDIILPFLLFAGALNVDISELKKEKLPVFVFAIFSTLISTFVVGYLSYFVFNALGINLPLLYCLLFGALISPTDPIAVLSIFKNYSIKKSLVMKVEGESLFNDGVGIVIFITISGMISSDGGNIELGKTLLLFLREAGGGIAFGLAVGWGAIFMLKRINTSKYAILTTLLIATFSYALAEQIMVSGPLAMVAAGLLVGNWMHSNAPRSIHHDTKMFWEVMNDVFNAMLFVLMGYSIIQLDASVFSLLAGIMAIIIVLIARFVSVSIPYTLSGLGSNKSKLKPDLKEIAVLTWSGLRGGLAFALALSLIDEPGGHFIVYITFFVAAFSIIVQGLTIGKLVTKLKLG